MELTLKDVLKYIEIIALAVSIVAGIAYLFFDPSDTTWIVMGIACVLGGVGEAIAISDQKNKKVMVALSAITIVVGVIDVMLFAMR